jgi:hypothetical protein
MSAKPRRRRGSGSLGQLKGRLWAAIEYSTALLEDHTADHELRLKAANALIQSAQAYGRLVELYDLEREVKALEQLSTSNGHHSA